MADALFLSGKNLPKLLDILKKDFEVYFPLKKDNNRFYRKYEGSSDGMVIGEVRAFEPLKAFFSPARERVASGFSDNTPGTGDKPFAVVGVKACDLKGFRVQDNVFLSEDCEDPFFASAREKNLIISCDCTCAIDTCFCRALGIQPHPTADFDINLSIVKGGYVVETGSPRGEAVVSGDRGLFAESPEEALEERRINRENVASEVDKMIEDAGVPDQSLFGDIIERNFRASLWEEESRTCVECGACTIICPTCHCFLLYDQKDESQMERMRVWDSCMLKDYARVAGGANPRGRLWMRLRNRFEKKFDFFPKVADVYACTGCGRCIAACPARIDIRKVLKKLVESNG